MNRSQTVPRWAWRLVWAACGAVLGACPALSAIDLELRPADNPWLVGDTVAVGLYAVSDDPGQVQTFSALRLVFGWEPGYLDLIGLDQTGAVPLQASMFPAGDMWGLNEQLPPQDGDGLYQASAPLGMPIETTSAGVLVTTLLFEASARISATLVDALPAGGDPLINTAVIDGLVPGLDVTGTLTGATIVIVPEPGSQRLLAAVCAAGGLVRRGRRRR